ncbi:MAG: hypothetical protein DRQ55_03145 [Planctomycetota bacterium]|nr:MAG: hypothetical protein DRQ55_03145 [Planctomycetota bacterium]
MTEASLARAALVAAETRHPLLVQTVAKGRTAERQQLDTALMDTFRELGSVTAYTLLVELNHKPFTLIAARQLRMMGGRSDPQDVVQEAFLAIYRYPTRFRADKPGSFRNWSYSILRNTVYRSLHKDSRDGVPVEMLAEILEDPSVTSPLQASSDAESSMQCKKVLALMLSMYLQAFETELKDRDREALRLVEVERLGYREAAERLGIKLENFKMVVCRARKKIHNFMIRVLGTRSL